MATNTQMRSWWKGYWRRTDRMVRIAFPGQGRIWRLLVADKSAPIWQAVSQIMSSEPYLFRESAGGTYHPRTVGSTSLHPYGLAMDLNPGANPQGNPPDNDYPATFIERMEGIRANGKQAVLWGGRWPPSNPPDAMHWQINVAPSDCRLITWDPGNGDEMAEWKSKDGYTYTDVDEWDPHDNGIKFVIDGGIMLGNRNTTKKTAVFMAQDSLERGEFATVMKRFSDDVGLTDEVND